MERETNPECEANPVCPAAELPGSLLDMSSWMKDTAYFPHDCDAQHDPKVQRMVRLHGWGAYGVYWAVVENLYRQGGKLDADYELLAYSMRTEATLIEAIVTGFDLFYIEEGKIRSKAVDQRLEERRLRSEKAAANGRIGGLTKSQADGKRALSEPLAKKKIKEKKIKEEEEGRPAPAHRVIQKIWNECADPSLPRCREVTGKRDLSMRNRWDEHPDPEFWKRVVVKVNSSSFLLGKSDRGWMANMDWLLRPDSAVKVLEGTYSRPGEVVSEAVQAQRCSRKCGLSNNWAKLKSKKDGALICRECFNAEEVEAERGV